jgi:hypothetical protein
MGTWLGNLIGGSVVNGQINSYKAKRAATKYAGPDRGRSCRQGNRMRSRHEGRRPASSLPHRGAGIPPASGRSFAFPIIIYFWWIIV